MKAAVVTPHGVELQDVPAPTPNSSQVLIRVAAAGLNRADLAVAAGNTHGAVGGVGTIVGMEFAGVVVDIGADVKNVGVGDPVMASGAAAFAEYAVTDWGRVHLLPKTDLEFTQAATLPIALQTMHNAVVTVGGLLRGETILVQGASSGVGLMALQIAKYVGASRVIGSSTNSVRRSKLMQWGADMVIDTSDPIWVEQVLQATEYKGVDLLVDQVSASVANANLKATRVLGRIVNVGRLGGAAGNFDFDLHAARRISYIGVTFRTRSIDEIREINRRMRADLWDAVTKGELKLPLDRVFRLDDVKQALDYMKSNQHFGKVVLEV